MYKGRQVYRLKTVAIVTGKHYKNLKNSKQLKNFKIQKFQTAKNQIEKFHTAKIKNSEFQTVEKS